MVLKMMTRGMKWMVMLLSPNFENWSKSMTKGREGLTDRFPLTTIFPSSELLSQSPLQMSALADLREPRRRRRRTKCVILNPTECSSCEAQLLYFLF